MPKKECDMHYIENSMWNYELLYEFTLDSLLTINSEN